MFRTLLDSLRWRPAPVGSEYLPGRRDYGELSPSLRAQLERVTPAVDGAAVYRPCRVYLRDGHVHDRVYVMDAQQYLTHWGVWPDDDAHKRSVNHQHLHRLEESPDRLPSEFAEILYREGESGMGYYAFVLEFSDGTRQPYVSGGAIDFIEYPSGKTARDIRTVWPHQGRSENPRPTPAYVWCLYGVGVGRSERSFDRDRVATDLHPVAVRQARDRIVLWSCVIVGACALVAAAGLPRSFGALVSVVAASVGLVFVFYEWRWWSWLRRRTPAEAFPQIEYGWPGAAVLPRLTLSSIAAILASALWWAFAR